MSTSTSGICLLLGGLEPPTFGLQDQRSTAELKKRPGTIAKPLIFFINVPSGSLRHALQYSNYPIALQERLRGVTPAEHTGYKTRVFHAAESCIYSRQASSESRSPPHRVASFVLFHMICSFDGHSGSATFSQHPTISTATAYHSILCLRAKQMAMSLSPDLRRYMTAVPTLSHHSNQSISTQCYIVSYQVCTQQPVLA